VVEVMIVVDKLYSRKQLMSAVQRQFDRKAEVV